MKVESTTPHSTTTSPTTAQSDPLLFVIFGATGDLVHRKLLPALYHAHLAGLLPQPFHILGISRDAQMRDADFRAWALGSLAEAGLAADDHAATRAADSAADHAGDRVADQAGDHVADSAVDHATAHATRAAAVAWCAQTLFYEAALDDPAANYRALSERITSLEAELQLPGNRIFYLALPPAVFGPAIEGLGAAGLNRGPGWTRLVIEKPFGRDLASAKALNKAAHRYFEESQIYRIDHYLGKETVQNLLVLRFANPVFEAQWNRDHVESVEITVAESLGVEKRAGYYDQAGALRDMVQNHLTQILTLVAMEVPVAFEADAIRSEKVKVLRSISPIGAEEAVFGQYGAGVSDGHRVPAYRAEPDVAAGSGTETYVAMKLDIDNWRWQGVPFFLRAGKRMAEPLTQVVVTFRSAPVSLFAPYGAGKLSRNRLRIVLQPNEGFALGFEVKVPGEPFHVMKRELDFYYHDVFGPLPDAYQTLILDVILGDQTLFVRADEVEASWRLYTPLLKREHGLETYRAGSWGPAAADELVRAYQARWINPVVSTGK